MARSGFKKIDVTRAIEATRAGGLEIARVEIDPLTNRIVIVAATESADGGNELDKWLKKHAG